MFALHNASQIVDMSSVLQQGWGTHPDRTGQVSLTGAGSVALVVISAIHIGLVASSFWILLGNALVALQIVESVNAR